MPPEIVWRRKRGMGVPLTQWCLQDFWRDLVDWLNPGIRRYWQPDIAARLAKERFSGTIHGRRTGEILWLAIMWQMWRRQMLPNSRLGYQWFHPFLLPFSRII